MGETSGTTLGVKELRQKLHRAPTAPLPQQSSSSAREEEDQWEVMEERPKRRIAFESLAKGMLGYLDNCNEVKVGITVLQERVGVPLQSGISIHKVAQQAVNEDGQKIFEVFWQGGEESCIARWEAQRKGLVDLERRCQDLVREKQMLNKRQEIFQDAIEGKPSVQDTASERMQDRIIEEIKDLEHRKTEEALQIAVKEHDLWMYQNEKEKAKRLQGVRKLRQDEEIAWAPPRNMTKWPDWEEARTLDNGEWRLEPEGEAEVPEIIIVSDSRGPGWRKPSRAGRSKALEKRKRDAQ